VPNCIGIAIPLSPSSVRRPTTWATLGSLDYPALDPRVHLTGLKQHSSIVLVIDNYATLPTVETNQWKPWSSHTHTDHNLSNLRTSKFDPCSETKMEKPQDTQVNGKEPHNCALFQQILNALFFSRSSLVLVSHVFLG